LFREFKPTYTSLIPGHLNVLSKTKEWNDFDMSSLRYLVIGSQLVEQWMIDALLERGVKTVANWYGMTEMPPPVLIGYNSTAFDFTPKSGYTVEFADDGECIVNGMPTRDIFNLETKEFVSRKDAPNGATWKNTF
jgi:acyl-CoA synthetase (AMP-forming)/AMP-acid ligase II